MKLASPEFDGVQLTRDQLRCTLSNKSAQL